MLTFDHSLTQDCLACNDRQKWDKSIIIHVCLSVCQKYVNKTGTLDFSSDCTQRLYCDIQFFHGTKSSVEYIHKLLQNRK